MLKSRQPSCILTIIWTSVPCLLSILSLGFTLLSDVGELHRGRDAFEEALPEADMDKVDSIEGDHGDDDADDEENIDGTSDEVVSKYGEEDGDSSNS